MAVIYLIRTRTYKAHYDNIKRADLWIKDELQLFVSIYDVYIEGVLDI